MTRYSVQRVKHSVIGASVKKVSYLHFKPDIFETKLTCSSIKGISMTRSKETKETDSKLYL